MPDCRPDLIPCTFAQGALRLVLLGAAMAALPATATQPEPPKPTVSAPSGAARATPSLRGPGSSVSANGLPDAKARALPASSRRLQPELIIRQNPEAAARAQLPAVYAPTRPRSGLTRYPWKTDIVTTVFWIGEPSTGVTAACNTKSSWDPAWQVTYGGFDDPDPSARRWDFSPQLFEPGQNPFYIALPFNDITNREIAATVIPWYASTPRKNKYDSVIKGRWVAVRLGKKTCYAQWEDVGPFETDDWAYVFGRNPQPKTVMNNGVGLDVSPAVRDYLGLVSGIRCDWRFCEVSEVPDGPWRKFGTNNPFVNSKDRVLADRIGRLDDLERLREQWLKHARPTALDGR